MVVNVLRRLRKNEPEWLILLACLGTCLGIGLVTLRQYGASWDEPNIQRYADYALKAYRWLFHPGSLPLFDGDLNYKGPTYFMAAELARRGMRLVAPSMAAIEAWHLVNFVMFLICAGLLYAFARRWMRAPAALGMCLLFISQPLFWGHAFINPKDVPFMTLFLASVYVGFAAVDRQADSGGGYALWAAAAILLGLTTSFRSSGPLAGAIVAVYALARLRRRAAPVVIGYAALAALVSYLTWPFLWVAPLSRFMESLSVMSKFPFPTKVLFMGRFYGAEDLPWFFYPWLLGIQLTLPLVLLVAAGLGVAVHRFIRHRGPEMQPLLLFAGWFLLPAAAIIWGRSTLYDNGRQLFFLLPPVILLAGLALDAALPHIGSRAMLAGAVLLLMLPGLYGIIRLHPYEYTYYNQLAGGTGGASGRYETDYWGTSYREAALWLNEHAAPGARLWVSGPSFLLQMYLRPDLVVSCAVDEDCGVQYDYVVALARWKAERQCPRGELVFAVERRGVPFATVKRLGPGETCRQK